MKKALILLLALLVFAGMAIAQNPTYAQGAGIQGVDKLGAHQNGGRGCVGCHAPHSGARGNGGSFAWDPTLNGGAGGFATTSTVSPGDSGDETLWGQDLGPIYGLGATGLTFATGSIDLSNPANVPGRIKTGVVMCLSCHDGNVAKGAMMTNVAFEKQFLSAAKYGTLPIPTLLGNDGGTVGNYMNDHPVGLGASVAALTGGTWSNYFQISNGKLITNQTNAPSYTQFRANYGLPLLDGARAGAGWAVDGPASGGDATAAYVVCTTCHTPHSMHVTTASSSNPLGGATSGTFPTYFFIAAPYNPAPAGFPTDGSRASSATQFCRQCHFRGAGGSNEYSGISIPTAF